MNREAPVRWIVVGAGSIGRRHLRTLLTLDQDVVAVRRNGVPLEGALSAVPVRADIQEAAAERPSIAIICTPTAQHVRDAVAAVAAGCHVLVEKPLSASLDDVDELVSAVERASVSAGVAYCLRFHPVLIRVRELVADGAVGVPRHVSIWAGQHLADWRPTQDHRSSYSARPELGGGVLRDLSHEIDYMAWIFGRPRSLGAMIGRTGTIDIASEDVADLMVSLESGTQVAMHLDYLARPPARGGIAVGSNGSLRWDLIDGSVRLWSVGDRTAEERVPADWTADHMYRDELVAFAAEVGGGTSTGADLAAGRDAVAVIVAAELADERGERVAVHL